MLHKLRARAQDEKGFTLIELLVVILIIGILAAIALPAFLDQRAKAQDTEAKTEARTTQTAMETFYTDEQTYNGQTAATLRRSSRPSVRASRPRRSTRTRVDAYAVTSTPKTGDSSHPKLDDGPRRPHLHGERQKGCPAPASGSPLTRIQALRKRALGPAPVV